VCKCAVQRNSYQLSVNARLQSFEAWRQLVEVLLTGCPADLLSGELRQNVIFELLQDLLDKVSNIPGDVDSHSFVGKIPNVHDKDNFQASCLSPTFM